MTPIPVDPAAASGPVDRVAECEALRAEDVPGPRVERPMPSKATALEIARLAEVDGENGLEQSIDYCLGLLEPYAVPRWDQDRIVIENGWLDGRCGRCGEALPKSDAERERDEARAQLAAAEARLEAVQGVEKYEYLGRTYVMADDLAAALASPPEPEADERPTPLSAEIREIAELWLYDGDTDQPINDGYFRALDLANRLESPKGAS